MYDRKCTFTQKLKGCRDSVTESVELRQLIIIFEANTNEGSKDSKSEQELEHVRI